MKIVIDIPEYDYVLALKNDYRTIYGSPDAHIAEAIKEGVILPKNHGRLIDADAFIAMLEDATERQRYKELLIDDCLTVDDVINAIIESLQNEGLAEGDVPTIIEAESEEEE